MLSSFACAQGNKLRFKRMSQANFITVQLKFSTLFCNSSASKLRENVKIVIGIESTLYYHEHATHHIVATHYLLKICLHCLKKNLLHL